MSAQRSRKPGKSATGKTTRGRKPKRGRKRGGKVTGYWPWKGRGWYYYDQEGTRQPLRDAQGVHIRDLTLKKSDPILQAAYALVEPSENQASHEASVSQNGCKTIGELSALWLPKVKQRQEDSDRQRGIERKTGEYSTYDVYARIMFDLCYGLPYRCRNLADLADPSRETEALRFHEGYKDWPIEEFTLQEATKWVEANPRRKNTRAAWGVLRTFLNWSKKRGYLTANPIAGEPHEDAKDRPRIVLLEPDQEDALLRVADRNYRPVLATLIRTGCRPGCEYGRLRKRHVICEAAGKMKWHFPEGTKYPEKARTIWITDENVIEWTLKNLRRCRRADDYVFRNSKGDPWSAEALRKRYNHCRAKVNKKELLIPADVVGYATRHTYAKRMLEGYWGKAVTLERLAVLMGDTLTTVTRFYSQIDPRNDDLMFSLA